MATALVAILIWFAQTEGLGMQYKTIESVAYSPVSNQVVVSKLTARDARVRRKAYVTDTVRTISKINLADGLVAGIIDRNMNVVLPGSRSTFHASGRNPILCNPHKPIDYCYIYRDGDVRMNDEIIKLNHRVCSLADSKSGKFIAAAGDNVTSILDSTNNRIVAEIPNLENSILGAPLLAFNEDETKIVSGGWLQASIRDIQSGETTPILFKGQDISVNALVNAPNNNLIVCSDLGVSRYDYEGNFVTAIDQMHASICSLSANGKYLVTAQENGLTVYDLDTDQAVNAIEINGISAVALSPSGLDVVVGFRNGKVALFETTTGNQLWMSNPPGTNRTTVLVPTALLGIWALLFWQLSIRRA
ncbi:MAG: hypothetical protein AAGA30_21100 [Planctomycetota bacterium]